MERLTRQRKDILGAIKVLHHANLNEIYEYLKKKDKNISLSTVYRNLDSLSEDGLIRNINPHLNEIYEITDMPLHNHFLCKKCNKIIDLKKHRHKKQYDEEGNLIEDKQTLFIGICKECLEK